MIKGCDAINKVMPINIDPKVFSPTGGKDNGAFTLVDYIIRKLNSI